MDVLKALAVAFLLVGDEHCVFLLCKVLAPHLHCSSLTHSNASEQPSSDSILSVIFAAQQQQQQSEGEEESARRFCVKDEEGRAYLLSLLLQ